MIFSASITLLNIFFVNSVNFILCLKLKFYLSIILSRTQNNFNIFLIKKQLYIIDVLKYLCLWFYSYNFFETYHVIFLARLFLQIHRNICKHRNKCKFQEAEFDTATIINDSVFYSWLWLKGLERDLCYSFQQWSSNLRAWIISDLSVNCWICCNLWVVWSVCWLGRSMFVMGNCLARTWWCGA